MKFPAFVTITLYIYVGLDVKITLNLSHQRSTLVCYKQKTPVTSMKRNEVSALQPRHIEDYAPSDAVRDTT